MTYVARESSAHAGEPLEAYKFVLGLVEWHQTSADIDFALNGDAYVQQPGLERGNLSVTDETPRESLDVVVPRDHPVAALFNAQAPDGTLYLTIYREHRGDSEFITLGKWRVLGVTWSNSTAKLKCEPLFTALARPLLRLRFSVSCRHDLFDTGCKVLKAAFALPATVTSVPGVQVTALAFGTQPSGYLKGGELDAGLGRRRRIIEHVGDAVTLTSNIPGLGPGDAVTAFPGCNKLINGDCLVKFNNTDNHGGFPNIPNQNPFEVGLS